MSGFAAQQGASAAPREPTVIDDVNNRFHSISSELGSFIRAVDGMSIKLGRPAEGPSPVPIKGNAENSLDLLTLIETQMSELRSHLRRLDPNV